MIYISNLLGLWRFNNSMSDEALNNDFVLNNDNSSSLGISVAGSFDTISKYDIFKSKNVNTKALVLEDVSYEATDTLINEDFTIAFWYKSETVIGFTRNIISKDLETKTVPIIAKSDKTTNDLSESVTNCSFFVIERSHSSTENQIAVGTSSTGTNIVYAYSSPYTPGTHLVLITYDSSNNRTRIDIDGIEGTWTNTAELNVSTSTLKINSINPNYLHHQASGLSRAISELYIKKEIAKTHESSRLYTYGIDYVVDKTLARMQFASFPMLLTQPSTITTTRIIAEGSNIYAARSNGVLLKGAQNYWDTELTFDSNKKNTLLNKSDTGTISFASDGVTVNGAIISI